jgi:isopenicillin-N epimerase
MTDSPNLREHFLLEPGLIYFNHGSQGACPRVVLEAAQEWQRVFARYPCAFGRTHGDAIHDARRDLAVYLGAEPNNLVYVVNATTGINIIARALDLTPGDEVLTTDHEYGAIERTWTFNCDKRGAKLVHASIPVPVTSSEQVVEAIWSAVTPRTKVLTFSHIASPTAWIFPAQELVRRARQAGIITVIDGAHAPGQIPLALDELGAEFYTGNCHKWMMSPAGSAFLYARSDVQNLIEPLVISWGWRNEEPRITPFVDEQQVQGTRDVSAFLAVPVAIDFMREHNWDAVRARCHDLVTYARREMQARTGIAPLTPEDGVWYSQMNSIPLPECDPGELGEWLREEHHIEIPVFRWQDHVVMRLSVQGYNTQEEVDKLINAVCEFTAS